MDNDRAFKGRLSDRAAYPFAAIVVLALAGIIGLGLAAGDGVEVALAASLASRGTAPAVTRSPSSSPSATGPVHVG